MIESKKSKGELGIKLVDGMAERYVKILAYMMAAIPIVKNLSFLEREIFSVLIRTADKKGSYGVALLADVEWVDRQEFESVVTKLAETHRVLRCSGHEGQFYQYYQLDIAALIAFKHQDDEQATRH